MATVTPRPAPSSGASSTGVGAGSLTVREWLPGGDEASNSDRYLADRLAAATADYKGVALTTFLLGAGLGALLWLGVGILAEHWLVAGGLPRWLRWGWLALGVVALAAAAVRWLVPLVRCRVNLVYAAREIEREHPELHNDLVNTVLVKAKPEGSPAVVVTSLKRRTARRLADVAGNTTMDRSTAVRLAYALLLAVAAACLYEVLAPKSMLVSAARLVAPWIPWAAPSRVRVDGPRLAWRVPDEAAGDGRVGAVGDERRRLSIEGGRGVMVRGRQLEVSAAIRGLRAGEQPTCVVTPLDDAGLVDPRVAPWQTTMHSAPDADAGGRLYTALLPDASRGVDRSLQVSIAAGDAHTEPVRVTVVDAPSLLVREVRYDFPAYTHRQPEMVEWRGDLRALEETHVTLSVESNQPLEAAWIDFGCDGQRDLKVVLAGPGARQGTVRFHLRLNADRTAPQHAAYRLMFQVAGADDAVVTDSLEHRIEVIADVLPEITLEEPADSPLRVPPGSPVTVRVRALDPDFGLARVGLETRIKGGGQVTPIVLLDEPREGVFKGASRLVPDKLGAGPGTVLEYRGFAIDTKPQQTNVTHTEWRELQIDAAAKPRPEPRDAPGIPDEPRRRDGARDPDERDRARREAGSDPQPPGADRPPGTEAERQDPAADPGAATAGEQGDRRPRRDRDRKPDSAPPDEPGQRGAGEGRQAGDDGAGAGGGRGESSADGQQSREGDGRRSGQPRAGDTGNASDRQGGDQGNASDGDGQRATNEPDGGGRGGDDAGGRSSDGRSTGRARPGQTGSDGGDPGDDAAAGNDADGAGAANRQRERVAADGTNDGEAMERMLRDREARESDGQRDADASRQPGDGNRGTGDSAAGSEGASPEPRGDERSASGETSGGSRPGSRTDAARQRPAGAGEPRGDDSRDDRPGDREGDPAGGGSPRADRKTGDGRDADRGAAPPTDRQTGDPGNDGQRAQGGDQTRGDGADGTAAGSQAPRADRPPADATPSGDHDPAKDDRAGHNNAGQAGPGEDRAGQDRDRAGQPGTAGQPPGKTGQRDASTDADSPDGASTGTGTDRRDRGTTGDMPDGKTPGGETPDGETPGDGQPGGSGADRPRSGGEGNPRSRQQPPDGGGDSGGQPSQQQGDGAQGQNNGPAGARSDRQSGGESGARSGAQPNGEQQGGEQQGGRGSQARRAADADGGPASDRPEAGEGGAEQPGAGSGGASRGAEGAAGSDEGEGAPPAGLPDGASPPDARPTGATGKGGWTRSDGAADPQRGAADGPAPAAETEWGDQDVAHARNAADLAIEHLRRSLQRGDDGVLDALGWNRDEARAFLERWENLRRQAESGDPAKRREFERTLRSLGLRGGNVRSDRDVPADVKGGQAEGRRSRPPSEYRERFKAYTKGTSGE